MPNMLQATEKEIQESILEWLTLKRIFCFRQNTGALGVEDSRRKSGKRVVRFATPGCADIIGLMEARRVKGFDGAIKYEDHGRFLAIEVKSARGKQSLAQHSFQQAVERSGGLYILARSLDDVIRALGEMDRHG